MRLFLFLTAALSLCTTSSAQPDHSPAPEPCIIQSADVVQRDAFGTLTWPDGVIPYAFDDNVDSQQRAIALSAMQEIMNVARIRFVPRDQAHDCILLTDAGFNGSFIGRIGGPQRVYIASWNFRFIVVHELMHALGSHHEQSRPDRDEYVTIHYENIDPGAESNFDIRDSVVPEGEYDLESVMHYGRFTFSENGQPTITLRHPYKMYQNIVGQRQRLSDGDVLGLIARYGERPRADFTGDNLVNGADLGVLLEEWGSDAVDANGDGVAGTEDLGILLAEWDS